LITLVGLLVGLPAVGQILPAPTALINTSGDSDALDTVDEQASITTDGAGTWVAVWSTNSDLGGLAGTDTDIFFTRSVTNGEAWAPSRILNDFGVDDTFNDSSPTVHTDGQGVWIALWSSNNPLGTVAGTDRDILISRSTDGGINWSPAALLVANAAGTDDSDSSPRLATDEAGNWVAVWASRDDIGGVADDDVDIAVSTSSDGGLTWSNAALLNNFGAGEPTNILDSSPKIKTDGAGNWVTVWYSNFNLGGTAGLDNDIFSSTSTDNGATWTDAILVNTFAELDDLPDQFVDLATDKSGTWMATWSTPLNFDGNVGNDSDIVLSTSTDNGTTWSLPTLLNSNGFGEDAGDFDPSLAYDGQGNWAAVWESTDPFGSLFGDDTDIFLSVSSDRGSTWSAPALIHDSGLGDGFSDERSELTTDGRGNWIAVWESFEDLGGLTGTDGDVHTAFFTLAAPISASIVGDITLTNDAPATCAVVEATAQGNRSVHSAVTDLNGAYLFSNLSPDVYDLRIVSPQFGDVDGGSVDITTGGVQRVNFQLDGSGSAQLLTGRITDQDTGAALVGVFVEVLKNSQVIATTYTCATGEYGIDLSGAAKATVVVDLRYSLANYETKLNNGISVPDEGTVADDDLKSETVFPASLAGFVVESGTIPVEAISGAQIILSGPVNTSVETNDDGVYSFPAILPGLYTIQASAPGFDSFSGGKKVDGADLEILDIALVFGGISTDLDGNGEVNAVDVQLVINAALGLGVGPGVNADVDGSGDVNAVDVQLVINAALGLR
jgi:hypothetical protein